MRLSGDTVSPAALAAVHDVIHDRWFELDRTVLDVASGTYLLYFGDKRRGPFDRVIRVIGVTNARILDEAKIGIYDINILEVNATAPSIAIVSGFPLRIELDVESHWEVEIY